MLGEWVLRWETIHPLYRIDASFASHQTAPVLGSDYRRLLGVSKNRVVQMYYAASDLERKTSESLRVLNDRNAVENYLKASVANREELIRRIQQLVAESRGLSNAALAHSYGKIMHCLGVLHCSYDLSRPEYFYAVEEKIKSTLSHRGLSGNGLTDAFVVLTSNPDATLLDEEQADWLSLVLHAHKTGGATATDVQRRVSAHQAKYGWIGASEQHAWDVAFYNKKLEEDLRIPASEIERQLAHKAAKRQELARKQRELQAALNLDDETLHLLRTGRTLAHLRLDLRLAWVESGCLLKNAFDEIARRTGVPAETLELYRLDEMNRLLVDGKSIEADEITRRNAYAFTLYDGKLSFVSGKTAVAQVERAELAPADNGPVTLIKGSVANPGLARGVVKIINSLSEDQAKEVDSMQKGQILVTGMTRPHLIHAIAKAAAIVTDEGGMLCHAAIVSREFGLPCIVGTKNATKLLHDGDLVEVDANAGIVTLLDKHAVKPK